MSTESTKPPCPHHPNSPVIRANVAATDKSVWLCVVCGKFLGDAGHRKEPIKETFTVKEVIQ